MARIAVIVEDGIVTGVYSDTGKEIVDVIDYDNIEAGDDEELAKLVEADIENGNLISVW